MLDADATPGELSDGKYKVFVEMERSRHVPEQIIELLDGGDGGVKGARVNKLFLVKVSDSVL